MEFLPLPDLPSLPPSLHYVHQQQAMLPGPHPADLPSLPPSPHQHCTTYISSKSCFQVLTLRISPLSLPHPINTALRTSAASHASRSSPCRSPLSPSLIPSTLHYVHQQQVMLSGPHPVDLPSLPPSSHQHCTISIAQWFSITKTSSNFPPILAPCPPNSRDLCMSMRAHCSIPKARPGIFGDWSLGE